MWLDSVHSNAPRGRRVHSGSFGFSQASSGRQVDYGSLGFTRASLGVAGSLGFAWVHSGEFWGPRLHSSSLGFTQALKSVIGFGVGSLWIY